MESCSVLIVGGVKSRHRIVYFRSNRRSSYFDRSSHICPAAQTNLTLQSTSFGMSRGNHQKAN
jgi:hypothetical protein